MTKKSEQASVKKASKKSVKAKAEAKPAKKVRVVKPKEAKKVEGGDVKGAPPPVADIPIAPTQSPIKAVVEDSEHSISLERADEIADSRITHEDERPPNSKLEVPELVSLAWENVKGRGDPPLSGCVPSHVERVFAHAQGILRGGSPQVGDTVWARLEQKVAELAKGQ